MQFNCIVNLYNVLYGRISSYQGSRLLCRYGGQQIKLLSFVGKKLYSKIKKVLLCPRVTWCLLYIFFWLIDIKCRFVRNNIFCSLTMSKQQPTITIYVIIVVNICTSFSQADPNFGRPLNLGDDRDNARKKFWKYAVSLNGSFKINFIFTYLLPI